MAKKLTIEFIKEQFENDNFELLTEEYINKRQKLEYICPKRHLGSICWDSWKQGSRCAECAGKKKPTIELIRKEFKKDNYILLTTEYLNNRRKLDYICSKGHRGSICWDSWRKGSRCLICSGIKKLTIKFIRNEFEKEDYTLLTEEYINAHQKLEYICPNGHKGSIMWNSWQQEHRCSQCHTENNKGKNNPNWNSNLTDKERLGRSYFVRKAWSDQIKKKDDNTCQICEQKGRKLEAHHIESYDINPELRIDLSNGVTLCEECHKNFHQQHGYGNNTRKQFEEFISRRLLCD